MQNNEVKKSKEEKQSYTVPTLLEYGSVAALTQEYSMISLVVTASVTADCAWRRQGLTLSSATEEQAQADSSALLRKDKRGLEGMIGPIAFGVRLESELPLDLLPQVETDGPSIAFEVTRARCLPCVEREPENSYWAQGRHMTVFLGKDTIDLSSTEAEAGMTAVVAGLLHFELFLTQQRITCVATEGASDESIRYWFLQQILPIFLLFNGSTEFLHATAVNISPTDAGSDGAVCFLGCSGIGKSTLLNHFLEQGCALITDEHLALSRSRYNEALPSLPFYRPYRSLEDLGLRAERFSPEPVPLRRMYLLTPDEPDAPVAAHALPPSDTVNAVMLNQQYRIFSPNAPHWLPILRSRFSGLARLTRMVPVRRLYVPRRMDRLPEVYRFIQNDLKGAA